MKTIREIAEERGLQVVETTSSMTGYPSQLKDAIIGFDTEEDAKKLAKEEGLDLVWIDKRDGWQLWHRGSYFDGAVSLDPEDVGAVFFARTEEDVYDELNGYLEVLEVGRYEDIRKLTDKIANCKDAIDEVFTMDDNEAVPYRNNGFGDAIQVEDVMQWYYGTKHNVVAAVRL